MEHPLPFDGAISKFYAEEASEETRKAIKDARKDRKDTAIVKAPDAAICGGPDLWHA